jgi:hypothetical protein
MHSKQISAREVREQLGFSPPPWRLPRPFLVLQSEVSISAYISAPWVAVTFWVGRFDVLCASQDFEHDTATALSSMI